MDDERSISEGGPKHGRSKKEKALRVAGVGTAVIGGTLGVLKASQPSPAEAIHNNAPVVESVKPVEGGQKIYDKDTGEEWRGPIEGQTAGKEPTATPTPTPTLTVNEALLDHEKYREKDLGVGVQVRDLREKNDALEKSLTATTTPTPTPTQVVSAAEKEAKQKEDQEKLKEGVAQKQLEDALKRIDDAKTATATTRQNSAEAKATTVVGNAEKQATTIVSAATPGPTGTVAPLPETARKVASTGSDIGTEAVGGATGLPIARGVLGWLEIGALIALAAGAWWVLRNPGKALEKVLRGAVKFIAWRRGRAHGAAPAAAAGGGGGILDRIRGIFRRGPAAGGGAAAAAGAGAADAGGVFDDDEIAALLGEGGPDEDEEDEDGRDELPDGPHP